MSVFRVAWPIGQRLPGNRLRLHGFLQPGTVTLQSLSAISSKANMMGHQRPEPFPYTEKPFTLWHHIYDKTTQRFDDNSKIIIIDGPIAAGKSTLAKKLAEDLDMLYSPEANFDTLYVNKYGHDRRMINDKVPECAKLIDIKDFYKNPKHENVPMMQIKMLQLRFVQYHEALAHILNTGQGVVMDRSIYSDFVFMEAMSEAGYMPPNFKSIYNHIAENLKYFILQPHLVLYLDVPVDVVKQRIKERNNEWEVKSSVLTDKYLHSIERHYKTNFLKKICDHAEVMVYDWSNYGDAEVVVEDIERIDFEKLEKLEGKGRDWEFEFERDWAELRIRLTEDPANLIEDCLPQRFMPEMIMYDDDADKFLEEIEKVPGEKYVEDFNADQGDKVWFKT